MASEETIEGARKFAQMAGALDDCFEHASSLVSAWDLWQEFGGVQDGEGWHHVERGIANLRAAVERLNNVESPTTKR